MKTGHGCLSEVQVTWYMVPSSLQAQVVHLPSLSLKLPSGHRHSGSLGLSQSDSSPNGLSQVRGQGVLAGDSKLWPSGQSGTCMNH